MHAPGAVTSVSSAWGGCPTGVGPNRLRPVGIASSSHNNVSSSRTRRPVVYVACRSFSLGQRQFRTKAECREHIRGILYKYKVDEAIPTRSADHEDLLQLLRLHPVSGAKVGPGVDHFSVGLRSASQCFIVVRTDGSSDDFSYLKCLDSNGGGGSGGGGGTKAVGAATVAYAVNKAMRCAVADQAHAFKRAAFRGAALGRLRCPLRGSLIAWSEAHVDHELPHTFRSLQRRWLGEEGLSYTDIVLDAAHSPPRLPEPLLTRWQEFHRLNARLRILSAEANLSMEAKGTVQLQGVTEEEIEVQEGRTGP